MAENGPNGATAATPMQGAQAAAAAEGTSPRPLTRETSRLQIAMLGLASPGGAGAARTRGSTASLDTPLLGMPRAGSFTSPILPEVEKRGNTPPAAGSTATAPTTTTTTTAAAHSGPRTTPGSLPNVDVDVDDLRLDEDDAQDAEDDRDAHLATPHHVAMPLTPEPERVSLALAATASPWVRWGIAALLIAALASRTASLIIISSKTGVRVAFEEPGHHKTTTLFDAWLADFSFGQAVSEFLDSGAYLMCILVVGGSCIVPHIRGVALILAWLVPVHRDGPWSARRHTVLLLCDYLGRFSFVDVCFFGYTTVLMSLNLHKPLAGNALALDVAFSGEPVFGTFLGLGATLATNFLNQFLLVAENHVDFRLQCNAGVDADDLDDYVYVAIKAPRASLRDRLRALVRGELRTKPVFWDRVSLWAFPASWVSTLALLGACAAGNLTIVGFHMRGLAGIMSGGDDAPWTDFGLLTAPLELPSKGFSRAGTTAFGAVEAFVVFVAPVLMLLFSAVLWFVPLDAKRQRDALLFLPFIASWIATDVFLLTSVAAYWELESILEFSFTETFGGTCDALKQHWGILCVGLDRRVGPGLGALAGAVVCLSAMQAVFASTADRVLRASTATVGGRGPPAVLLSSPAPRMVV